MRERELLPCHALKPKNLNKDVTGGRIITREPAFCIAEFTGESDEINEVLNRLDGIRIENLNRSGTVAL